MPAHNNPIRVVNSPCGAEPPPDNALDFYGVPINVDYDDCAARYRVSKLTGEPSLHAFGETLEVDSLFARLWSLATLLEINGFETGGLVDFNLVTTQFSGHSQGAIFTYLMAKLFIVDKACVLAGPYDLPDNINPQSPVADWLTVPFFATDLSRVVTFNHVEDTVIGHAVTTDTLLGLGLLAPENVVDVSDLIYGPGGGINAIRYHSATAYDAFYSDLRQSLCF